MSSIDPNAGVALWVNILVPIALGVVFILVLVALYRSKREVSITTLNRVLEKVPFISKSAEETAPVKDASSTIEKDKGNRKDTRISMGSATSDKGSGTFTNDGYENDTKGWLTMKIDSDLPEVNPITVTHM